MEENIAQSALDSAKAAHKRIDTLEREVSDLRDLTVAVGKMGERLDGVKNDVAEIKADVKAINDRPKSMWDKVITAAITVFVSGIIGAALALIIR